MPRPALALFGTALLAACSPPSPPRDPDAASGNAAADAEVAAVINLQDQTEIQALKARVITLEREVGELKANPEALDLDLLTQRVERLEAAGVVASAASTTTDSPRAAPAADPDRAQRAVDAAIAERRAKRTPSN